MTIAPAPPTEPQVRRYAQLMGSVMFFVVTHALALVTMLLFLQPGVDSSLPLLVRAEFVRDHSVTWVIGWLPWQLSALSDLLVSITLLRYVRALPERPGQGAAAGALLFNLLAVFPEQYAELELVTTLVTQVHTLEGPALEAYMGEASRLFMILTGTVANTFYTCMLLGWMLTLGGVRRALGLSSRIPLAERVLLALFLLAGLLTYLAFDGAPAAAARYFTLSTAVNGLAFPGLILFSLFWAATLGDAHHARFAHPAEATWELRWPGTATGKGAALFADVAQRLGSPGFRDVMRVATRRWPYPTLRSQVEDVVYLNWMVPVERVRPLLPEGLELDGFEGLTPLSILTYRHGHFGPAFVGPLRRVMLSPIQSNWRVYLSPEPPAHPDRPALPRDAIAFISTALDSTLYTLGSRLGSDGLPSHRLGAGSHHVRERRDGGRSQLGGEHPCRDDDAAGGGAAGRGCVIFAVVMVRVLARGELLGDELAAQHAHPARESETPRLVRRELHDRLLMRREKAPHPEIGKDDLLRAARLFLAVEDEPHAGSPEWQTQRLKGKARSEGGETVVNYESPAPLPVDRIQLILPQVNTIAPARVESRRSESEPWLTRQSATFYRLASNSPGAPDARRPPERWTPPRRRSTTIAVPTNTRWHSNTGWPAAPPTWTNGSRRCWPTWA